jgi:hypothetical protein
MDRVKGPDELRGAVGAGFTTSGARVMHSSEYHDCQNGQVQRGGDEDGNQGEGAEVVDCQNYI